MTKQFIKDRDAVLKELYKDDAGRLLVKSPCRIHVPVRFASRGLGVVGSDNFIYGCFAIILQDNRWAFINVCSYIEIDPQKYVIVTIDDVDYYEFYFEAKQPIFKTMTVVKRDEVVFNAMDELYFKGKIPWYVKYEEVGKLFRSAQKFAGLSVCKRYEVYELFGALISRDSSDKTIPFRKSINQRSDLSKKIPTWVAMHNVFYGINSTLNRIAGSYMKDGVVSALVNPTETVGSVEKILRA